ncbi:uncharacterized protein PG998_004505 [Apiospora kogelbergensis]|uniref:uncharacterized protein n=1 Tax=Apiospora kogelbergensis TaxID=1337665 RepID=UPI00312D568F
MSTNSSFVTTPFKHFAVSDTAALSSIASTSEFIGYYPEGQSSDVVKLSIYQSSDTTSANATTYFWCADSVSQNQPTPVETILWRDVASIPLRAASSSTVASSTGIASATGSFSEPGSPDPPAPSQVWIVGAVLGPIAACVLVGAIVFFLVKRRYQEKPSARGLQGEYSYENDQMVAISGHEPVVYSDGTMQSGGKAGGRASHGHDQITAGSVYDFDQPVRVR